MSLFTLLLEQKPVDVALSMSGTRLALLSDHDLAVYALDMNKRPIPKPELLWRSTTIADHCPRHVTFLGDDQIYIATDKWDEDESYLWRCESEKLVPYGSIVEGASISSLVSSVDRSTLYTQEYNGALHRINTEDGTTDLPHQAFLIHKFPSLSTEIQITEMERQVRELKTQSSYPINRS